MLRNCKHANTILDTRMYQVYFSCRDAKEFSTNNITECMYTQSDVDGNQYLLIESLVDHCKCQSAVTEADSYVVF